MAPRPGMPAAVGPAGAVPKAAAVVPVTDGSKLPWFVYALRLSGFRNL